MKKYLLQIFLYLGFLPLNAQVLKTEADITNKQINTNQEVGCVIGNAAVSLSGNATYTLPIFIPDGIRGIQPSISINYSHNSSNGLLGIGWHLKAYSTIEYDSKNIYNDGITSPNSISGGSPFLLDGIRLILINATEYRTESESFTKIIASSATKPQSFTVFTKSGLTLKYGTTTDSKIQSSLDVPVKWFLTSTSDTLGNFMEYKYVTLNNERVLRKIIYTNNSAVSNLIPNQITFNYSIRTDSNCTFSIHDTSPLVEAMYKKNKLDSITIQAEGKSVKQYSFIYGLDPLNLYTYLNEVVETGFDLLGNSKSLNSTMFKYGNIETANTVESFTPAAIAGKNTEILTGDFNGDGLDDLFVAYYTITGSYPKQYSNYKVYLRNSNGLGFPASNTPSASDTFPTSVYWNGNNSNSGTVCNLYVDLYVTDVDGNGNDDITVVKRGKTSKITDRLFGVDVLFGNSDATSFTLQNYSSAMASTYTGDIKIGNYFMAGDFNGDSRTDWITTTGTENSVKVHFPALGIYNVTLSNTNAINIFEDNALACAIASSTTVNVFDFDGDGKDDIAYSNYTPYSAICDVEPTYYNGVFTITFDNNDLYSSIWNKRIAKNPIDIAKSNKDFNGDGKADAFIPPPYGSEATIRFSTGCGQTKNYKLILGEQVDTQKVRLGTESFLLGDYNGDGKTDIAHYYLNGSTHNFAIYYSNGLSFKRELNTFSYASGFRPSVVADFNGDGRDDIMDTIAGSGQLQIVYFKPKNQEFLLTKVKDGYERLTEFQYKLYTEPNGIYTYTNPTTNSYPIKTAVPRSFGVAKMIVPDGVGDMMNTTGVEYSYENALTHIAGKGFLGFRTVKNKDLTTAIISEQTNDFIANTSSGTNFYLFGLKNAKTYFATTSNTLQTLTTPSYMITDLGNKRYFLKTTNTVTDNFITDAHTASGRYYDANGNLTASCDTIFGGSTIQQISKTSVNTFLLNGSWIPYLPDVITDTLIYKNNAPFITQTDNDYDGYGRLINTTAYKHAASNRQVSTAYEYNDVCGLLTKTTTTTAGQPVKYTRYEYKDNKRTLNKTFTGFPGGEQCVQEIVSYDPRYNLPTKITNGLYTNYSTEITYDAFGRVLTSKQLPNDITSTTSYNWDITAPTQIYNSTTTQPGKPFQKTYYDRFDRVIKTETQNFQQSSIQSTTAYDEMGRIKTATTPDAATGTITTTYNYGTAADYFKLKSTNDGFKTTNYDYYYPPSISPGEVKTKIAVPSGTWREQTVDATGKLIKATDDGGDIEYTYNSAGQPTAIKVGGVANSNTMQYDAVSGVQTSLTEKNAGTTTYRYDNCGQLVYQKDNAGFEDTLSYDIIGRLIRKERKVKGTIPGQIIEYLYNTATANGREQLQTVKVNNKVMQQYAYDNWHRPIKNTEYIDDTAYITQTAYKNDNSIDTVIYPNNLKINYVYSSLGYLKQVKMGNTIIYETQTTNALNMPTSYKLNNGRLTGTSGYNAWGTPISIMAYKTATPTPKIQDLAMSYNAVSGDLLSRTDNTQLPVQSETFTYNASLSRLETATVGSRIDTTAYTANKNGNILSRSRIGTYSYDANKIHAVTDINYTCGVQHPKDSFLNKIYYTPFNQPDSIVEQNMRIGMSGSQNFSASFTYNPQYMRTKMATKQGAAVKATRYYVGNYEKLVDSTGAMRHLVYIGGANGLCAIASTTGSNTTLYYVFTDHLGSILKITDSTGTVLGEQSFDAWGRERNYKDWAKDTITQPVSSPFASITSQYGYGNNSGFLTRGFTGHEHLPQFNLINMNGRLYDPTIGRMLSPDNYVQDPTHTQSYNRYSYVQNNPLKYTDPSGWILKAAPEKVIGDDLSGGGGGGGSRGNIGYIGDLNSITGMGSFGYNYMGSYSAYASNPGGYAATYGTQTWMQQAVIKTYNPYYTEVKPDKIITNNPQKINAITNTLQRGSTVEDVFELYGGNAPGITVYASASGFVTDKQSLFNTHQWIQNSLNSVGNTNKGGESGIDLTLTWSGRVNDFFDATGKVSMVSTGKAIGRVTLPAGVIIGAAQIGRGYYKDGNKFGYDAQKATTGFAGGLIGAWAGFQAGVWVGFEGGFALGAAFGGIGAIPGAVTGGVIGGFGGAFGGAYYGGQFGESLIKNKVR